MTIKQAAYQRIQILCQERNTTINEILKNCDIDTHAANALISGTATDLFIEDVEQICEALNICVADFFGNELFLNLVKA